jgi:hypothetical protein
MDTSGPGFRHWYDLFMKHCMANGYYVLSSVEIMEVTNGSSVPTLLPLLLLPALVLQLLHQRLFQTSLFG